jgi:D-aminopeptidase
MFNHLSDAYAAAESLLAAVLDEARPPPAGTPTAPDWLGTYVEPESGLAVRIDMASDRQIRLRYGHSAELLDLNADGSAGGAGTRLRRAEDGVRMDRPQENQHSRLVPCAGEAAPDIAGRYRCEELDAEVTVTDAGGVLSGGFSGFLGQGRMEALTPAGPDLWMLPCPRALDHTPPGDWTLAFRRDAAGRVDGLTLGCWLARRLDYRRIGSS